MTHLQRVYDYLRNNPGVTSKDVAKALACRRSSVERWLAFLVNDGRAVAKITPEATQLYMRKEEAC